MSPSLRAVDVLTTVGTLVALLGSVALLGRGATLLAGLLDVEWFVHGATGRLLFVVVFVVAFAFVFRTWQAFYDGVEDAVATE